MNDTELWMKLEALAHLRGLPHLAYLRKKLEDELVEANADLAPKDAGPKAIPSEPAPEPDPTPESDPASVERRA